MKLKLVENRITLRKTVIHIINIMKGTDEFVIISVILRAKLESQKYLT